MLHCSAARFCLLILTVLCAQSAFGAATITLRLSDGTLVSGEPIAYSERGIVLKDAGGNFSKRMEWGSFTEDSLKKLAQLRQAAPYVQPLLVPEEEEEDLIPLDIKPKRVERLNRIETDAGLGAMFSSPVSLSLFLVIFLANIYAGYEIAIFRNYNPFIGGGAAFILPFIGPLIFVCIPTRIQVVEEPLIEEEMLEAEEVPEAEIEVIEEPEEAQPVEPNKPEAIVYSRGHTSFNRRFFETKFAGFLRVVPGEAEQGMEIFVQSARGDYVGSRLAKVAQSELFLQIEKGGASSEVNIPYSEIREVQVRPREG